MKSKEFNMVLLMDLNIIYIDWWDCEKEGLEFLGSSGRITVCSDYCSVVGKSGCDGVR
jgi:hypothetical protein